MTGLTGRIVSRLPKTNVLPLAMQGHYWTEVFIHPRPRKEKP